LRYYIVRNFLPEPVADGLRSAFDAHFAEPQRHTAQHQVWNYWHVPQLYTYLRTQPEKILPAPLVDAFLEALRRWAVEHLGLGHIAGPYLSLYVDDCRQNLHNDAENGRWAYVFSLTRWDSRRFSGGETILLRDVEYWSTDRCAAAGAGAGFYDLVAPEFNQLLIFDDRCIHGVEPIQGNMDPLDGRVILHGHIREAGVIVEGALAYDDVTDRLRDVAADVERLVAAAREASRGIVTLRAVVSPMGVVDDLALLTVQLSRAGQARGIDDFILRESARTLHRVRFPRAKRGTRIYLPLVI
jgi:hypothetical protein